MRPKPNSETEIIAKTRNNLNDMIILETDMNQRMKTSAINTIKIAIMSFSNFNSIANNITNNFNKQYENFWYRLVSISCIGSNIKYKTRNYLSLKIDELRI